MDNWPVSALACPARPQHLCVPRGYRSLMGEAEHLWNTPSSGSCEGRRVPILCIASCPKKRCRWLPFRYTTNWLSGLPSSGSRRNSGSCRTTRNQGPAVSSLTGQDLPSACVLELPRTSGVCQPCPGPPDSRGPCSKGRMTTCRPQEELLSVRTLVTQPVNDRFGWNDLAIQLFQNSVYDQFTLAQGLAPSLLVLSGVVSTWNRHRRQPGAALSWACGMSGMSGRSSPVTQLFRKPWVKWEWI